MLAGLCVAGGCELLAGAAVVDVLGEAGVNVLGSALIGAGDNLAVYGFITPCKSAGGWVTAGLTGALTYGGGYFFGQEAEAAGETSDWNTNLGTAGWSAVGAGTFGLAGYLLGNLRNSTAPGLTGTGLTGAGGGYATNSDVLKFLGLTRLFGGE